MVREWDPRTASSAEIESLLDTLNAAVAVDLPEDPLWRGESLREYLTEVMPGERRVSWVVQDEPAADGTPGMILGHAHVLLLGDIGITEVIVHPRARRQGVGRRLLAVAARRTYQEGFYSIGVEVVGGTPAVPFYESLGFATEYLETRSVLQLAAVHWPTIRQMADSLPDRFRVEFHPAGPPEPLFASYAQAKTKARNADDGGPDQRPDAYDPQRLRDSLDCLIRRGMRPYIVLAVAQPTDTVVGLTEVVVPAQHPTRADQYDTLVVPEYRGHRIEQAIKARMLLELRTVEPELLEVQTWNSQANETMRQVNAALGFRPDREWREYGISVTELVHRLDAHR